MRTEIEALKEIRDRISYFCSRTDGKYDPPWAQEVIGIIDDVLITPYRQCKRFGAPFYVEVGTSIVAIRCASNHDVVLRADHSVHGKATIDWAESVCTRMNQEANRRELGDAAKLREALEKVIEIANKEWDASRETSAMWEIWEICKAALAALARNCDMPLVVDGPADNNADKAWIVFKRHNPDAYFDVPGLLRCIDWLLGHATEKEGGAK